MGTQPLPQKGAELPPQFLLRTNGWMHQDATRYGGRPHPRGLCALDRDPAPLKFSTHVYYSYRYCDVVRTLHSRYWFVQVQVLVLYAFYF